MHISKKITNKKIKIITHNGDFHADEIFAVAVVTLFLGDTPYKIIRSRDIKIISQGDFVVDVGDVYNSAKNKFDHHQTINNNIRANGIPYASFGLVWKKFGVKLSGSKYAANVIEKRLVLPIDAVDNGVDVFSKTVKDIVPYTIHNILKIFCPIEKEKITEQKFNIAFKKMVKLAQKILLYEIQQARNENKHRKYIEQAYQRAKDKRIIIINGDYLYREIITRFKEPLFIVKPDKNNDQWKVRVIRDNPYSSFENRKDLPQNWAGKRDAELVKETGVKDAIFCHKNLFVAVAKSKEGAIELAKQAVENNEV